MKRLAAAGSAALLAAALAPSRVGLGGVRLRDTSIPVDPATQLEMHTTANCVRPTTRCYFTPPPTC